MLYKREITDHISIQYIILFTMAKAARIVTHNQLTSLVLDNCNIKFTEFRIALDNLEKIGMYAFAYCDNLTSINIPSKIEDITFNFLLSHFILIRYIKYPYIAMLIDEWPLGKLYPDSVIILINSGLVLANIFFNPKFKSDIIHKFKQNNIAVFLSFFFIPTI